MTGEDPDTVPRQDIPEPDGAVRRACNHVVGVGVETGAGDISQVTGKYPQGLVVVRRPESEGDEIRECEELFDGSVPLPLCASLPSHPVMTPRDKVVPIRGKLSVPHWVVVAFVAH